VNRGISGDTVPKLAARWERDALDHQPDVLSILVGVNDVAEVMEGRSGDATGQDFRFGYDQLLKRTRAELPEVRLVLGEPFYLPTSPKPALRELWAARVATYAAVVRELADAHDATLVPYQRALDAAAGRAPASHWIWDGIHPTYAGQRVLADAWIEAVSGSPVG
jgi:lysophospholipase L1-like esterase